VGDQESGVGLPVAERAKQREHSPFAPFASPRVPSKTTGVTSIESIFQAFSISGLNFSVVYLAQTETDIYDNKPSIISNCNGGFCFKSLRCNNRSVCNINDPHDHYCVD
jgi:hypothetical protein